jgi:hypothetical protein
MKGFANYFRFTALALLVMLLASGCGAIRVTRAGEMKTETHSVDLGAATSAQIRIEMGFGELKVDSAEGKLMEGTFNYNIAGWQPQVSYEVDGGQGSLVVSQPDEEVNLVNQGAQNRWDLLLNSRVPIDLEVSTGASKSELNLSAIDLTRLKVETGAGEGTIDLSGGWSHDLSVIIQGGVGNLTVILPREMGVRVRVETGIGNVKTAGLSKDGNDYVNEALGVSSQTLSIDIQAGIGAIDLQVR